MNMKLAAAVTLVMGSALLAGCEKKPETVMDSASEVVEEATDAVGDATDTRENESMKDAVEDMKASVSNAGETVTDVAKDAKAAGEAAVSGN
ncbi:hypothetical protein [Paraperlucidibaca sp.]|jgi:hypothetical protein|uniref:hypothetical protein n=1 Tax=Paraperlucidibaca sp. TaxID=2708021 RepID=UPI0030F37C7D